MIIGYKNNKLKLSSLKDFPSISSLLSSLASSKSLYITDEYILYKDNGKFKYINKHLSDDNNNNNHNNNINDESVIMKFLNVIKYKDSKMSHLFIGFSSLIVYVDDTENIYMYNDTIERIGISIAISKVFISLLSSSLSSYESLINIIRSLLVIVMYLY